MATTTSSAGVTETTPAGETPEGMQIPEMNMDFPPLYSPPPPPTPPEQPDYVHALAPSLPPYSPQFCHVPPSPPFFSFEQPVFPVAAGGWYDYGLTYPMDLWSHGSTTGGGVAHEEAACMQAAVGVGEASNAAVASAVGSSLHQFPPTLDVTTCWRRIQYQQRQQKQQQQKQWWPSKAARSNRRIARERNSTGRFVHHLHRSSSSGTVSYSAPSKPPSSSLSSGVPMSMPIVPPNNMGLQRLRFLLQKELRNSDVSNLGRIVLPKKETEAHLPALEVKEGIELTVRDVFSTDAWRMRFRFWPNNMSRMYVLENTGDFVKKYALKRGDYIALYQDDNKQIFICARKAGRPSSPLWQATHEEQEEDNGMAAMQTYKLMELKHKAESGGSLSKANDDDSLTGMPSKKEGNLCLDAPADDLDDYDLTQFECFPSFDECDLSLYDFKIEDSDDAETSGNDKSR